MSRTIDSPNDFQSFHDESSPARQVQETLRGKTVCPFCGAVAESGDGACARCTMENSPLTRQATRARLGPWYVLQSRNPSAPGMKYSVLLALVKKGQITPRSIVRGPTTNQFWRFAAKVRGVSREFGICWGCGQDIEPTTSVCPHCQRNQEPPAQPDQLLDSRQPLNQVLPVRREVRPSFKPDPREAAAQETMHPQRQRVQLPAPQREPTLEELTEQEFAEQRMMMQNRRLPSRQPVLPQTNLAAGPVPAFRDMEPQQPLGKILLLLGLMACFTVAGWLYVDINSRQKFFTWVQTTWNDLMHGDAAVTPEVAGERSALKGEKIVLDPPPQIRQEEPAVPAPAPSAPEAVAQVEPVLPSEPEPLAVAPAAQAPDQPAAPADPPAALVQALPPQVRVAVGAGPEASRQQQPRIEVQPQVAPERTTGAAVDVSITDPDELISLSRKLWRQAIDAEARGEWAEAVSLYEQIKRLPAAAWPSGIDIRLNDARRRAQ